MKKLSLKEKQSIIEYFYRNIKDKAILDYTIDRLDLDKNSIYWQSRIQFLKDFQAYILKNWIDQKIKYIYPSIAYNI